MQLLQSNRLFFQFFLDSLYGVNTPSSYLTFELTPPLRQVMEALIEEYYEEREFFQEIMVSHLLRLFSEFARIHYAYLPKDRTEEPGPAKIPQVLLYMRQNYAQVDLSSVAEHFHYSPRHLSRLIHEKTGRTFLKWVNTYKPVSYTHLNSDKLEVQVEMTPEMFSDALSQISEREKELVDALKAMLGIYAKVHLVAPKTITRSEGKAVRVIDKRKLY